MYKFLIPSAALLALALSGPVSADTQKATDPKADKAAKTHDVAAEIVSVDDAKKTVTLRGETGDDMTLIAEGAAAASLKSLKSGDKVTATLRDNEKGEPQAVTSLKPAALAK